MEFLDRKFEDNEVRTKFYIQSLFLRRFMGYQLKDVTLRANRNGLKVNLEKIYVLSKK